MRSNDFLTWKRHKIAYQLWLSLSTYKAKRSISTSHFHDSVETWYTKTMKHCLITISFVLFFSETGSLSNVILRIFSWLFSPHYETEAEKHDGHKGTIVKRRRMKNLAITSPGSVKWLTANVLGIHMIMMMILMNWNWNLWIMSINYEYFLDVGVFILDLTMVLLLFTDILARLLTKRTFQVPKIWLAFCNITLLWK